MINFVQLPSNAGRDVTMTPKPTKAMHLWREHPLITSIYIKIKHWQGVANCQDGLTKAMIDWVAEEAVCSNKHQDGYYSALCNWLVINLWTRYHQCKRVKDKTPTKDKNGNFLFRQSKRPSHFDNKTYAVWKEDWSFVDKQKRPIQNARSPSALDSAALRQTFRNQKNGKGGKVIDFAALPKDPRYCVVTAACNILNCHKRLGAPELYPLAIYKLNKNSKFCSFFVARGVKRVLKEAGWRVYYPDVPQREAQLKFTCHSICIGTCALLYSQIASNDTIQARLCWISDKWKRYICHILAVTVIQKKAVYHADSNSYEISLLSVGFDATAATA